MEELIEKEESESTETKEEVGKLKKPGSHTNLAIHQPKPYVLANLNRSVGKWLHATNQTKRPHKPRKGK
ncbi:MAG: hypothetical protein ACD_3C00100G0010 [uncultured bacterium (gcode 4)]|uniref:Uncharacterized protein n=1 Tax=uncultured bacterium (gcode 4) TaxID=1234023 RepID=K2GXI2_9BACT|nr:MAG: hypothetical protein ACD_3C00100G0010 [uncultured bacterium (gcode 4)]